MILGYPYLDVASGGGRIRSLYRLVGNHIWYNRIEVSENNSPSEKKSFLIPKRVENHNYDHINYHLHQPSTCHLSHHPSDCFTVDPIVVLYGHITQKPDYPNSNSTLQTHQLNSVKNSPLLSIGTQQGGNFLLFEILDSKN